MKLITLTKGEKIMKKLILVLFLLLSTLSFSEWLTINPTDKWNESTDYVFGVSFFDDTKVDNIQIYKRYFEDVEIVFSAFLIELNSDKYSDIYKIGTRKNDNIPLSFKVDKNNPIMLMGKRVEIKQISNTEYRVSIRMFLADDDNSAQLLISQMKKGNVFKMLVDDKILRTCNLNDFSKTFNKLNPGKYEKK